MCIYYHNWFTSDSPQIYTFPVNGTLISESRGDSFRAAKAQVEDVNPHLRCKRLSIALNTKPSTT